MTKITQAQRALLTAAAADPGGATDAPTPKSLYAALVKQRLIIVLPQTPGPDRLLITDAGRAIVAAPSTDDAEGIPDPVQAGEPTAEAAETPTLGAATEEVSISPPIPEPTTDEPTPEVEGAPPAEPSAPGGKLGVLVGLLRRPEGARLEELTAATGWQVHSVRGTMAGALKKRGLVVASEKTETGRLYRLPTTEAQA